jgi:hypothetical protein
MYAECLSPYTPMSSKQAIKKDYFIQSRTDSIQKQYKFYPKVSECVYSADWQGRVRDSLPGEDDAAALCGPRGEGDPEAAGAQPGLAEKRIHDPEEIGPSEHR